MRFLARLAVLGAVLAALGGGAWAKSFTFDELASLPRSLAKDYYIFRFAQSANETQLKALRPQIQSYRGKIKKLFESRQPKEPAAVCPPVSPKNFTAATPACQRSLLTIQLIRQLPPRQLASVKKTFINDSKTTAFINAAKSADAAGFFARRMDADGYFDFFAKLGSDEQKAFLATKLPQKFGDKIAAHWRFAGFISNLVLNKKTRAMAGNFLNLNAQNMNYKAAFSLGLLAILSDKELRAKAFFERAASATTRAFERDNANFWIYLITNQEDDLRRVAMSGDVNLYTIYAREALGDDSAFLIASPLPTKARLDGYDIADPFAWLATRAEFGKLAGEEFLAKIERFYTKETLGEYSFLMERFYNYKIAFFAMPHAELLAHASPERKALIYALMRQESRFVAGQVSPSYALGPMQFMPFLSRDIGAKLELADFDEDDVFKPAIALKFADYHLDYLEKFLHNPALVAYAYNGGIGFTSRFLKTGDYFNPATHFISYEPFLSMELITYEESKIYAKKVLANYVIYLKLLGSNASIVPLLQNLMKPSESDYFRAQMAKK